MNYTKFCSSSSCFSFTKRDGTKNSVKASFIGLNVAIPQIGDTIDTINPVTATLVSTVLTSSNYADMLYEWVRYQQIRCFGTKDSSVQGVFFPKGQIKGTRPKWTPTKSPFGDEEDQSVDYVTNETKYELPAGLDNQCFINDIIKNNPEISIIDFLNNGVQVMTYGSSSGRYITRIMDGSTPLTGDGNDAIGELNLWHKGNVPPCFYRTANETEFNKKINSLPSFTTTPFIGAGLVEFVCSARSRCTSYLSVANSAFDFTVSISEEPFATCLTYELYACKNGLETTLADAGIASLISINPLTGFVTSPAGLPVGEYELIAKVKNACCVTGETCIKITSR